MDNTKNIEQINKFIEKSQENKIPWKFISSNLLRWVKEDGARTFTTTLQSQQMAMVVYPGMPAKSPSYNYFLTIQATNPNEIILQISTVNNDSLKVLMEQLFNQAASVSKNSSSQTVNKLLENL